MPTNKHLSRRSLLALPAASLCLGLRATERVSIGLQLFSVRNECAQNLPGTLAAVGKLGYEAVEFAGFHGRSAAEIRQLLKDNGLECCGSHTPLDQLTDARISETVEFNQGIGNTNLIVPGVPAEYHSTEGWVKAASAE